MKYLKSAFKWISESTARTFTGIVVLSLIIGIGARMTHAATSYDVTDEAQMNLDVSITSTQTTGIILSSPQVNGANFTFSNLSGGILRIRYGAYREDIYYTSATVASTKKVTLVGVTRNICSQYTRTVVTCGAGRSWGKGAIVELTVDARLLNLKANIDRSNTYSARDGVRFSGSGTLGQPTFANTTVRDAQMGATPATGSGLVACVVSTGLCYDGLGGAWVARGSNSVSNASITVAGKAQAATSFLLANLTDTGATGALSFLTPSLVVKNGSGSTSANKIPLLDGNGVIVTSMGGNGTGGTLGIASGAILVFQKNSAPKPLYATSANQVIVSTDGRNWAAGGIPQDVDVLTGTTLQSNTLAGAGPANFNQTGSLTSTQLNTQGYMFKIVVLGAVTWSSGTVQVGLKLGGTDVSTCSLTPSASGDFTTIFYGVVRKAGASGVIHIQCAMSEGDNTNSKLANNDTQTTSFNTTANKTVNIYAANSATSTVTMNQMRIYSEKP